MMAQNAAIVGVPDRERGNAVLARRVDQQRKTGIDGRMGETRGRIDRDHAGSGARDDRPRRAGRTRAMKLIVFDVDGTLVDSQHLIVAAQGLAFAENGLPAPGRREALSVVGLSLPQAFRRLVG